MRHADQRWDHYADRWQVITPGGEILAERVLVHPHTNEQPFTRSLSEVKVQVDLHKITVRAHDSVHVFGGKTMEIGLD